MATFLPQQTPSRPVPEFLPSSPPDQAIFSNLPQQPHSSTRNGHGNGDSLHHRQSADFRANGAAPYTVGNGVMPAPNTMSHQIPNPASRHRGTMSLGAFDGPRSPPNTKSKGPIPERSICREEMYSSLPCRHFTCPLQIFQIGTVPSGEGVPFLTLD